MAIRRRIFASVIADMHLSDDENALKWGIVERIEEAGFSAEVFTAPPERRLSGRARRMGWTFENVEAVMRSCSGHVLVGMPRWPLGDGRALPTDFHHYEGALSYSLRLPTLIFATRSLLDRVVYDRGLGRYIVDIPSGAGPDWLETPAFLNAWADWLDSVGERKDVFLGYSSGSRVLARSLNRFIENEVGAKVWDWAEDFPAGDSILQEIKSAADRCTLGIFLFTCDDKLEGEGSKAAPRDNVVFETGYFASLKGHDRVLVVVEEGAKIPADLGGQIYVPIKNRADGTEPIERRVRSFLEHNLR